jgi:hypothetical protein
MKSMTKRKMIRLGTSFLVLALCVSMFSAPALAQRYGGYPPGHPFGGRPYGPPPPHHRHRPSDFDKALAVVGAVGAIAVIANARNSRYNNYYRPPAVVVNPRPAPVIVERQVIVEQPVVVERHVPVIINSEGTYSPKLGALFRIENMQIPGHRFTAARLTSDPMPNSPLNRIGLRKGDVITRLDNNPADTLAALERPERNTSIRYIKTGTTKVLLDNIYIPTDAEVFGDGIYHAP